ncbi:MAG UNVERIFIED_CONTAM: hypothetical protein LVR18_32470 [Planctomycetaceae bacterium]
MKIAGESGDDNGDFDLKIASIGPFAKSGTIVTFGRAAPAACCGTQSWR